MTSEKMRAEFREFADSKGCDLAHAYDIDRSRFLWLSPHTAELWEFWQAATRRALPDGFVPVPVEATEAMVIRACDASYEASMLPGYDDLTGCQ